MNVFCSRNHGTFFHIWPYVSYDRVGKNLTEIPDCQRVVRNAEGFQGADGEDQHHDADKIAEESHRRGEKEKPQPYHQNRPFQLRNDQAGDTRKSYDDYDGQTTK